MEYQAYIEPETSYKRHNLYISNMFILFISGLIFILCLYFLLIVPKSRCNLPPSPPRLPLMGNLHQLGNLAHCSLRALSHKYGPLMLLHIGCVPTIIISSKEMAYELMKTHDSIFASRPPMIMAKIILYGSAIAFSPYGDYWRQARKISVVHLLNAKMVQSFRSVREEEVSFMVDNIHAGSGRGSPVNLTKLLVTLTNDITCRVALGKYYGLEGGENKVRKMLLELGHLLGSLPFEDIIPWLWWGDWLSGLRSRARKHAKEWDDFLEEVLEEHVQGFQAEGGACKDGDEVSDLVHVLLSLDESNEAGGVFLKRENIKGIIMDIFAAGTDTSYSTLEWAMAELVKNPKEMERVHAEVRGVVGCKEKVTAEDIDKMSYLKAIVKETLRFHPPVALIPREAMKDVKLQGYDIPGGTRVMVNVWAIGRDHSSWEQAEEFCPERFIHNNVDFGGQDFQFVPFGAGRRMCPGINFAIPIIELALANLVQKFDWEVPKGMEQEVLDMSESSGLTLHKTSNLVLIPKPWVKHL